MPLNGREDLEALRKAAQQRLRERDEERPKVMVGMGTCGIAAGAQAVYDALVAALAHHGVEATMVKTGCIGMCVREPLVDIQMPHGERITYGNVKPEDADRLVEGHIVRGEVVAELAVARFVGV